MTTKAARCRIGHVLPSHGFGGTEVGTARLVKLTTQDTLEHVIFYPVEASGLQRWLADQGLHASAYQPPVHSLVRHFPDFLRASQRLARQFAQASLTAVHCADILAAQSAGLAARMAGLPLICHVRGRYPGLTWRDCLILRLVEEFIFVSADSQEALACRGAARRGRVIYDGIDLPATGTDRAAACAAMGVPPDRIVIGMVARIAPPKDHLLLLEAAVEVVRAEPRCHIVLVGGEAQGERSTPRTPAIQAAITAHGLNGHVTLLGHRDEVRSLLPGMDLVTLVSQHEGLPLVLLEAMAEGIPVVASAVGGIPELIAPGVTGLLHRPGDARDLADQLLALATNPGRRQALGDAGRARVARDFSTARFAIQMAAVYGKYCSDGTSPAQRPT